MDRHARRKEYLRYTRFKLILYSMMIILFVTYAVKMGLCFTEGRRADEYVEVFIFFVLYLFCWEGVKFAVKNLPQTIRDIRLFSITYGDGNEFLMDLAEAGDITEADKVVADNSGSESVEKKLGFLVDKLNIPRFPQGDMESIDCRYHNLLEIILHSPEELSRWK